MACEISLNTITILLLQQSDFFLLQLTFLTLHAAAYHPSQFGDVFPPGPPG